MRSVSIVIPAFNEEARLGPTLAEIIRFISRENWRAEVLVVDDGSSDRTAQIVEGFALNYSMIRLVRNDRNRGKGHSVRHGVQEASGDVVFMMDADLAVPMTECQKLIAAINAGFDVAIGSRALDERLERVRPPFYRRVCSSAFRTMVRILLGLYFKDTQCGFKAFTREAAKATFALQTIETWGFDPEVLLIATRLGYRITEVAVETFHREGSKINPVRDSINMFHELLSIRRNVFARMPEARSAKSPVTIPVAQESAKHAEAA
jgi:glycosyltransferase involved in cell wall biosynthesis